MAGWCASIAWSITDRAVYGDVVLVTTLPQRLDGVRGFRRTEIHRASDGTLLTEADTVWVWVRLADGRPTRIPPDLMRSFAR